MKSQFRDILGIVAHGFPRYRPEAQEKLAEEAGARAVLHLGKRHRDLDSVLKQGRKGGRYTVQWLFMVCTVRASAKAKRDIVATFVDDVREMGAEIFEIGSGRCTSDTKQRREMLSDAYEAVTRGRQPSQTNVRGRRKRVWTAEQKDIIWSEWFSVRNATNEDAATKASKRLGFKVDQFQMWHVAREMKVEQGDADATGASGRPWKTAKRS